jgi:muconate cycloisomerase
MLVAPAALGKLSISRIEVFSVRLPALRDFTIAGGAVATAGQTMARVLVRIEADGVVGWGEATPTPSWTYETTESITSTIRNYLAPALIGHAVWDLDGAHRIMNRAISAGYTTGSPIAKAGIDLALHDLVGRALGVSVGQLWGQRRVDSIPLNWIVSAKQPERAAAEAGEGLNAGYGAFKIKVGLAAVEAEVERVAVVRAAAPSAPIWVDANQGYLVPDAIKLARLLEPLGVSVLEQPIRANDPVGSARVRSVSPIPIAIDESLVHPVDLATYARLDAIDLAVAKVQRSAGLYYSRRLSMLAEDLGIGVIGSGLTDSALGFAASLHLFAATGMQEPADLNGPQFLQSTYTKQDWQPVVDGRAAVPTGAGLGVDVDEDAVRDLARRTDSA